MTKHKHYYAIRAYADGWKIEYKNYLNTWCLALNPVFEGNREYRVIPDENGWLPWYGGECPVDPGTVVETRVGYCVGKSRKARDYNCGSLWGSNITAYRVIEEKAVITDLTVKLAECQAREAKLLDDIDRRLECAGITIYSGRPQRDDTALKEAIKQAKREAVNHILEMWHEPWPRTERRFIDRLEAYAEELK